MGKRWKLWVLIGAVWLAAGIVLGAQLYLTVLPRGLGATVFEVMVFQLLRAALWFAFTPVVMLLVRRFPLEGARRWLDLGLHTVASFAFMFFNYFCRLVAGEYYYGLEFENFGRRFVLEFNGRALADVGIYWIVVGVLLGLRLLRRHHESEIARSELQAQLAESELRALKQQLQPHFLFNTLNSVAMLVREKREEKAVDTIAALSALLRRLIDSGRQQEVSFAAEIEFTQHYLDIEQTRFGDRLTVRYDVSRAALDARVPALLLQPLVENAVKHGISRRSAPGRIAISAEVAGGQLRLEVANDNADGPASAAGTQLGLATTRQRLTRLYGRDFVFDCFFNTPEGSRVVVVLPHRVAPAAASTP